jgi:hypothetical protein
VILNFLNHLVNVRPEFINEGVPCIRVVMRLLGSPVDEPFDLFFSGFDAFLQCVSGHAVNLIGGALGGGLSGFPGRLAVEAGHLLLLLDLTDELLLLPADEVVVTLPLAGGRPPGTAQVKGFAL